MFESVSESGSESAFTKQATADSDCDGDGDTDCDTDTDADAERIGNRIIFGIESGGMDGKT